jgi:hypothetical protein
VEVRELEGLTRMARKKSVFVVSRLNWRPVGEGKWWLAPGTARLASFPTRDGAETDRARREANARARVNPFRCGPSFAELTPMPEPIFLDWVRDTGLSPPKPAKKDDPLDWASWWDTTRPAMSGEQHARLWEGLNKLHFFRVDERPDVPVGYVVVKPIWQDNGDGPFLRGEGGQVKEVYRTRELAAGTCRYMLSQGADREWHPTGADLFDPETYWQIAMAFGPFDVVEIELDEGVKPGRKFPLVVRRAWSHYTSEPNLNLEERAPVRGFATKKDAEAGRKELEAEFRREWDVWPLFAGYWDWASEREQAERVHATALRLGLIGADTDPRSGWWWTVKLPPAPEQRAALWAAAPDVRVFEVIEAQLVK